jgi:hypothetical protein
MKVYAGMSVAISTVVGALAGTTVHQSCVGRGLLINVRRITTSLEFIAKNVSISLLAAGPKCSMQSLLMGESKKIS